MKKLIAVLVLCVSISSITFAQSFKLAAGKNENLGDTIFVKITDENDNKVGNVSFYIWFINTTSVEQRAQFSQQSLVPVNDLTWCGDFNTDPVCYAEDGTSGPFTVRVGRSPITNFHIEYIPTNTDEKITRYTLKKVGSVTDSATVVVCFSPTKETTTGILDPIPPVGVPYINLTKEIKWDAYPNPASTNSQVNIAYTLPKGYTSGSVVIRNIVGNVEKVIPFNGNNGKVTLPVKTLSSGIYLYSLILEGEAIVTKKLIIK